MRSRPLLWLLLSVLCFAAAFYFWRLGDQWVARRSASPLTRHATRNTQHATRATSPALPMQLLSQPGALNLPPAPDALTNRATRNTNRFALRLSNTAAPIGQLQRSDHALLLENALLDTAQAAPSIPDHLRAQGDPGSYLVQARGPIDNAFRSLLQAAGAAIVSYIPNNAYLVRASAAVAQQLQAAPQTQAVLPYEPYYKLKQSLLKLAVAQDPLPDNAVLNVLLFADARGTTRAALQELGASILGGEEGSPFGPVLHVLAPADGLSAIAGLPGVQEVEWGLMRASANDFSRLRIGVATSVTATNNYLGLSGSNVLVAIADSGVDATHPDLTPRVFGPATNDLVDPNGHGTHVAGIIASSGGKSATVTNASGPNGPYAGTNNQFRGVAPSASLFSLPVALTTGPFSIGSAESWPSDGYLQETAAQTNAFISNNSWNYVGADASTYDLHAASYDAAVRDALPNVPGSQPLLLVFSAGNAGDGDTDGTAGNPDTILSPATAKNVITVGAIEQFRYITNNVALCTVVNSTNSCTTNQPWMALTDSSNQVASFSSRGPVGVGIEGNSGRFKPDLVAPGTFVISTRSGQWDTNAYYNPTSHIYTVYNDVVIPTNFMYLDSIYIPANAVQLNLSVVPDTNSPVPFPNLLMYVNATDYPTSADPILGTNAVSLPPALALSPVGAYWYYGISNQTAQPVVCDLVTDIVVTNELGNYLQVLAGLNDSLGQYYRYESGTSMSAADVSGTLALMQEFFQQRLGLTNSPALMKALLINGARSVGNLYNFNTTAAVNSQGWGLINLPTTLPGSLTNHSAATNSMVMVDQTPANALATGQSRTYKVSLSSNAQGQPLRVTLVWTDPPGNPVASVKLVNDLNLIVTNLDYTNLVYFGNDIASGNDFNQAWNTNTLPNIDTVNNVENVFLSPALGIGSTLSTNYSITVVGSRVNVNAVTTQTNNVCQDYALVISSGDGLVANAISSFTTNAPIVSTTQPLVTVVTNSFANSPGFTGGILYNQRAGAQPTLLGTNTILLTNDADAVITLGVTNQWHFYLITNINSYTNAAFLTFLPMNLAVPRMGVFEPSADAATRPQADIDLYVAPPTIPNNYALTNLNPAVVEAADKSLSRGGTETIVYSNAVPGVYYVGIKSEDQQAAQYAFMGVFSLLPFSNNTTNGTYLVGIPLNQAIPDGSPQFPGVANIVAPNVSSMLVRRVIVTNVLNHELMGDLIGTLNNGTISAVLNNHTCVIDPATAGCETWTSYIYDDSSEHNVGPDPSLINPVVQHTDGPGSLSSFAGLNGQGQWLLSMVDNATNHIGTNISLRIFLERQPDLTGVGIIVTLQGNSCRDDFIEVPANATSLTVDVGVVSATGPVALSLELCPLNETACKSAQATNALGVSVTVDQTDLPPLQAGTYRVHTCNLNATPITVNIRAVFGFSQNTVIPVLSTGTVTPVPILNDAVTDIYLTNNSHGLISSLNVGLLINDPLISDLAITLISPNGTRVLLFENRGAGSTNGLGTFNLSTNFLMTPFYTNNFDLAPVGLYAPGAAFQGWNVVSNFVDVMDDYACLCLSNHILALLDGAVTNTLPTTNSLVPTNSIPYALSFKVNHLPWLEGMVTWWPLDVDGSDIFGGLDGLLLGDVSFSTGKVSQAYFGDGVATRMVVPRCSELDLGLGRGFSIEGWINPFNITNPAPLVEWYDPAPPTNQPPLGVQFWLAMTNSPGSLGAVLWDTNSQPHVISTAPLALTNAGWQHVALTYDTNSGLAALYVNGLTNSQPLVTANLGHFVPRTSGDFYLGFHPPGLPGGACFAGGLDEFSVYERALSPCEVNAIFNAGSRGKYGTNVLVCPVASEITLQTATGTQIYAFTNGLTWTNNGPQWETNTILFSTSTNPTPIIVSGLNPYNPADPNAPNNLNVVVDDFVLSELAPEAVNGLLYFTDDTNLATVPIKFAPTPFTASNFPPVLIFSNYFSGATSGVYQAGATILGSTNSPAIGLRNWTVVNGPVTVVSNAFLDAANTNWLAMATGAVQCLLPTSPGHRYQLSYNLRGPCAVGWWNGSIDPLSQRAQDLISGNNGAFFNGATNTTAAFFGDISQAYVGPNGLFFNGQTEPPPAEDPDIWPEDIDDPASQIQLADPPQLQFTNAFTIEGWFKPTVPTNQTYCGTEQLFFRGYPEPLDCRGLGDPYWLALQPATNLTSFDIQFHIANAHTGTLGADVLTTNAPVQLGGGSNGGWWHIAAVFDKPFTNVTVVLNGTNVTTITTNALRLYLNGTCIATNYTTLSPYQDLDPALSPGVTIGERCSYDWTQPFCGYMDELTVYARALTDPEIAAIAAAGTTGKADLSVPAAQSLAELSVAVNGAQLGVVYGDNSQWTAYTAQFTALDTNTVVTLQSLLPGTLVDGITLTEVADSLYYLPEVPLSDLYGGDAFGVWTLEIWDDRASPTTNNAQLVQWQLNFDLAPSNPPPVINLVHGIPYTNSLAAYGIQYFVVQVPQWATLATNILEFADQVQTPNPLPVTVLFNQTNYPSPADFPLIGPLVSAGATILSTNGVPPLVAGQTYYLAVTNPNPVGVTFALGVWFNITTLNNCQMLVSNVVGVAGIPCYFQFDVPTNGVVAPQSVAFWLSGAACNLKVVLSEHLPLPDLNNFDYTSQQPCTNDQIVMLVTNSTPFPIQTNRWYVGVFNTGSTNVTFSVQACSAPAYPVIIPLTNSIPFIVSATTSPFAAPPGPPQLFFFDFLISNSVPGVLFELYNLSGAADLVLQQDVPPTMAPYFDTSSFTGATPKQIVVRTSSGPPASSYVPDLRGHWYLGVFNDEQVNVAYTIRATLPDGDSLLVSGQPLSVSLALLPPARGLLLSWYSVEGERYFVQYAPSLVAPIAWTNITSVVATTPLTTFQVQPLPGSPAFYRIVQVFSLQPKLYIQFWPGNQVRLSWSTAYPGYTLQSKVGLFGTWANAGLTVTVVGNDYVAFDTVGPGPKYYRLFQ